MKNCVGIINLDENENGMKGLTKNRVLASVPFAGRYRIIDFILSNMTNSGVACIGIFTKNKSRSLMDHLTNGRPWDLHRRNNGLKVFNFGDNNLAEDDVHDFYENRKFIEYSNCDYVLLASSNMICNIDYNEVLEEHIKKDNDVTIVYKSIDKDDIADFSDCRTVMLDDDNRVVSCGENIIDRSNTNINMEMYILKTKMFLDIVDKSVKNGNYRKVKRFITDNVKAFKVGGYKFEGYVACINSLKTYYNANMDLLKFKINRELFSEENPIYTKARSEGPTKYTKTSVVNNSIVANGCIIEGEVKNCIIGRKVHVEKGAKLEGCIIMQESVIGKNAKLKNVIADKKSIIPAGEEIITPVSSPHVWERNNNE